MKFLMSLLVMLALGSQFGCSDKVKVHLDKDSEYVAKMEALVKQYEGNEQRDSDLGQYVINMMYQSKSTVDAMSQADMIMLARNIVRISNDIYETEIQKHGFITALQIESRFLRFAQSPTGPKGLGQVAKKAFHEALAACGIPSAKDSDVWNTDLNLYAAACYYKKMLLMFNNDPLQAIVAYNQGANSTDAKSYASHGSMNGIEPLKYVARFVFLQNKVTNQKTDGIPAVNEMPKPDKHNIPKVIVSDKIETDKEPVAKKPAAEPTIEAKVKEPIGSSVDDLQVE